MNFHHVEHNPNPHWNRQADKPAPYPACSFEWLLCNPGQNSPSPRYNMQWPGWGYSEPPYYKWLDQGHPDRGLGFGSSVRSSLHNLPWADQPTFHLLRPYIGLYRPPSPFWQREANTRLSTGIPDSQNGANVFYRVFATPRGQCKQLVLT